MSDLHVATEVVVDHPIETVWAYVVEGYFEHHSSWDPAVVAMVRQTPGSVRVGTRGTEVRRFGGKQSAGFEVTDVERLRVFGFRNTSGPFALRRCYRLTAEGVRTRVAFTFDMRPRHVMRLLFPLVRNQVEIQVHENIARLASVVTAVHEASADTS